MCYPRSSGPGHDSDEKPPAAREPQRSSWRQLAAIADFRAVCVVNAMGFLTVFGARSMLLPLIARDSLHLSNTAVGVRELRPSLAPVSDVCMRL